MFSGTAGGGSWGPWWCGSVDLGFGGGVVWWSRGNMTMNVTCDYNACVGDEA